MISFNLVLKTKFNYLGHLIKKWLGFYRNKWGICIIADLKCTASETVFNEKVNGILEDLEKGPRDYYITLIITSEFGFLKKLKGVSDDGTVNTKIRTVIYENSATAQLKEIPDVSKREVVKELIAKHYVGKANATFNAFVAWGHGTAYSTFKKPGDFVPPGEEPTVADRYKHFLMLNDNGFKDLYISDFAEKNIVPGNTPGSAESRDYLSMDELRLAILQSFGRKIDLLVLSICGMAYTRTGITLSEVTDFWIAGEQYTNIYAILPDRLMTALKDQDAISSPRKLGIFLCTVPTNANDITFRLYEMRHFAEFSSVLRKFSKAVFVNINANSQLILQARDNCRPIGNPTFSYHLISFFDFCNKLREADSPRHGVKFMQGYCIQLLELRKKLIVTHNEGDTAGLSIFFPAKKDILDPLSIDDRIFIGVPVDTTAAQRFRSYLWEFNVLKLLERK